MSGDGQLFPSVAMFVVSPLPLTSHLTVAKWQFQAPAGDACRTRREIAFQRKPRALVGWVLWMRSCMHAPVGVLLLWSRLGAAGGAWPDCVVATRHVATTSTTTMLTTGQSGAPGQASTSSSIPFHSTSEGWHHPFRRSPRAHNIST